MYAPAACIYEKTIVIPIVVFPLGHLPPLLCHPIILLPGNWTLIWNLMTIDSPRGPRMIFHEKDGIAPRDQTTRFLLSERISETQWTASFDANIETRVETFSYDINYDEQPQNPSENATSYSTKPGRVSRINYDPTIVIVHDPINWGLSGTTDLRAMDRTTER